MPVKTISTIELPRHPTQSLKWLACLMLPLAISPGVGQATGDTGGLYADSHYHFYLWLSQPGYNRGQIGMALT